MARTAEIVRNTFETQISLKLNLEGTGKSEIDTGCGFLNHMLILFAKHGRFDLNVKCTGDTDVDYHHTTDQLAVIRLHRYILRSRRSTGCSQKQQ